NDITDLLVTVDRKYLISSSKDKTVRVWDIANAKEENKFEDHTWAVTDIDVDAFGTYLVSGGLDGKINIYDLKTRTKLLSQELSNYKINALALSPDNTTIVAAAQPEGVSDPAGFFTLNTDLKARKIVLPKPFEISPLKKKYQEKELAKNNRLEEAKRVKEAKKAETSNISEEKILEKTEQVKITIKDNE
ncbi:hypothetical protein N9I68_03870, partial [Bacteroidia bacterium]|nr:hypothetical protein [Bacteroidia bacterium]